METQEFKDKVEAIGKLLNMAVEFPSDEDMRWNKYGYLKDGYKKIRISSSKYGNGGKFDIWADFPRTEKGEQLHYGKHPKINVSETKSPEQIAKDIQRRLMPEYLEALDQAIRRADATNKYNKSQKDNIEKLAAYFGIEFKPENRDRPSIYVYGEISGLDSRIEAYGENTVKFSLEIQPDLAIKIFDLMKADLPE